MAARSADGPRQRLSDVSEDELLALIFPSFAAAPKDPVGPGDDAAVVSTNGSVVVTTDAMVRGRDWKDSWSSPHDVAVKAVTQNAADIAAMGAVTRSLLVTLMADPATPLAWVLGFAQSLGEQANALGFSVAGGDLSSAPLETLVISITALGDLEGRSPVRRSGARPGDTVAVAGSLGHSAAGFLVLESDAAFTSTAAVEQAIAAQPDAIRARCLAHHLRPMAPLDQGPAAARAGATAMMDISDGLLRDGTRLAAASGVRLGLDGAALAADVDQLVALVGSDRAAECVLAGGEEHSLLATFPAAPPHGWRRVGTVGEGSGVTLDGVPQAPRGWDHFAGS